MKKFAKNKPHASGTHKPGAKKKPSAKSNAIAGVVAVAGIAVAGYVMFGGSGSGRTIPHATPPAHIAAAQAAPEPSHQPVHHDVQAPIPMPAPTGSNGDANAIASSVVSQVVQESKGLVKNAAKNSSKKIEPGKLAAEVATSRAFYAARAQLYREKSLLTLKKDIAGLVQDINKANSDSVGKVKKTDAPHVRRMPTGTSVPLIGPQYVLPGRSGVPQSVQPGGIPQLPPAMVGKGGQVNYKLLAAALAAKSAQSDKPSGPELVSVMIVAGKRRAVIHDGGSDMMVAQGQVTPTGWRVKRIREGGVQLVKGKTIKDLVLK